MTADELYEALQDGDDDGAVEVTVAYVRELGEVPVGVSRALAMRGFDCARMNAARDRTYRELGIEPHEDPLLI